MFLKSLVLLLEETQQDGVSQNILTCASSGEVTPLVTSVLSEIMLSGKNSFKNKKDKTENKQITITTMTVNKQTNKQT